MNRRVAPTGTAVTLASYNIHGGIGGDGHFVPNRIIDVLNEMRADVIALQEVESRATGFDMLDFLAKATGLNAIAGPTLLSADGDYGNGLLTRHRVINQRNLDLSIAGREPRGAIDAELDIDGAPLRVIATHLGLHPAERRQQVQQLLAAFEQDRVMPTVFMGDVNEWFLAGRPLRWLHRHFKHTPAPASFPARWPLFALDRIWVKPRSMLQWVAAHRTPMARRASDHLPLKAQILILARSEPQLDCSGTQKLQDCLQIVPADVRSRKN
jgi:endonuclease/exonuclease/phosphatase family metal-dependent hydrolase